MQIHGVSKIKLGDTEELPHNQSLRVLYISTDRGEFEIVLFNNDADKLKVFNLFEDKSI